MLRHRINVGRHHIQRIGPVGKIPYSQWLTDNFPDADRWDHQDLSGSSVLEAYNTALALGRDMSVDGAMEVGDPPTAWTAFDSTLDGVADERTGGTGSQSLEVAVNGAGQSDFGFQNFPTEIGKTFRLSAWIKNVDATNGTVYTTDGVVAAGTIVNATTSWVLDSADFVAISNPTVVRLAPTATGAGEKARFDDVTMRQLDILPSSNFPEQQLITEGNFPNDPGVWTLSPNWSIANNKATYDDLAILQISQTLTIDGLDAGSQYLISFDIADVSAGSANLAFLDSSGAVVYKGFANYANGHHDILSDAIPSDETTFAVFGHTNSGSSWSITNITVNKMNPMDGTTVAATVGVPTNFGSLGLSVVDDGATSYSTFLSAEVNGKWNPDLGFISMWGKSDTWAAGTAFLCMLAIDANYQIYLARSGTDLIPTFRSNGVDEQITIASGSPSGRFHLLVKWAYPGNVSAYYQGVPSGTPQAIANQMIGNLTIATFGAASEAPTDVWDEARTRAMLGYADISDAEVLSIYNQGVR